MILKTIKTGETNHIYGATAGNWNESRTVHNYGDDDEFKNILYLKFLLYVIY
jgi:hypothetical protein